MLRVLAGLSLLTLALVACSSSSGAGGGAMGDAAGGSQDGPCDCGGGDGGQRDSGGSDTGTGGGVDATADAPGIEDAKDESHQVLDSGPFACGAQPCSSGTECCAVPGSSGGSYVLQCMASCPDGGAPVECDSPQQCDAGAICCGTIVLTGTGTSCEYGPQSAGCTTSCSISVTPGCPSTEVVQYCAQKADCTDPGNANCCTLTYGGRSQTFCLSDQDAQLAMMIGAQCLQ